MLGRQEGQRARRRTMSTREWPMAISLVPTACALRAFASTPSRARTPHKSVKRNTGAMARDDLWSRSSPRQLSALPLFASVCLVASVAFGCRKSVIEPLQSRGAPASATPYAWSAALARTRNVLEADAANHVAEISVRVKSPSRQSVAARSRHVCFAPISVPAGFLRQSDLKH